MLAHNEIVGTVWPHLRAKVRRRRLKKATPAGPKKEAPGVKFDPPGVQFRVLGSPKRASGDLLGDRLGVLLAPLRPVSGRLSPPGGAPERLREVISRGILGSFLEVFWAPRPRS